MTKQKRIERRKYGNRSTEFVSCRFRSLSGSVKTGISLLFGRFPSDLFIFSFSVAFDRSFYFSADFFLITITPAAAAIMHRTTIIPSVLSPVGTTLLLSLAGVVVVVPFPGFLLSLPVPEVLSFLSVPGVLSSLPGVGVGSGVGSGVGVGSGSGISISFRFAYASVRAAFASATACSLSGSVSTAFAFCRAATNAS